MARYGGDEFVLFMAGAKREHAEIIVKRLKEQLYSSPFSGHDKQITVTMSAGVAVFPEDGEDLDQLLTVADQRMYDAKTERTHKGKAV